MYTDIHASSGILTHDPSVLAGEKIADAFESMATMIGGLYTYIHTHKR
jgi:hypothetical protein